MIKLNGLKVVKKTAPNIIMGENAINAISMMINICYEVDIAEACLLNNLHNNVLKYEFESCMLVEIKSGSYENIDNVSCTEIDYRILEKTASDIEETDKYEISRSQKKKVLKMVKDYLKTENFKKMLIAKM